MTRRRRARGEGSGARRGEGSRVGGDARRGRGAAGARGARGRASGRRRVAVVFAAAAAFAALTRGADAITMDWGQWCTEAAQLWTYDSTSSSCPKCYRGSSRPTYEAWTWCNDGGGEHKRNTKHGYNTKPETKTCSSPQCADCEGAWTPWTECGAPGTPRFDTNEKSKVEPFTGCGVSEQSREYIITREANAGATACSWHDGAYEIRPCDMPACEAPKVTFEHEDGGDVASNVFDFGITIKHDLLCGEGASCQTSTLNTREDVNCASTIQRQDVDSVLKTLGNNFKDDQAESDGSIALLDATQGYVKGSYVIKYTCKVTHRTDQRKSKALKKWNFKFVYTQQSTMSTILTEVSMDGEHHFRLVQGCEIFVSGKPYLVRQVLLNSPDYIDCKCTECDSKCVDDAKESVFRTIDSNPQDGELSFNEIVSTLRSYSADPSIVYKLRSHTPLSLGDLMATDAPPPGCSAKGRALQMTRATYPSVDAGRETTTTECQDTSSMASAEWRYSSEESEQPKKGDVVCVYVDGFLIETAQPLAAEAAVDAKNFETLKSGYPILRRIEDTRPVIDDATLALVKVYTFDDDEAEADGHDYKSVEQYRVDNGYGGFAVSLDLATLGWFDDGGVSPLERGLMKLDRTPLHDVFSFSTWLRPSSFNYDDEYFYFFTVAVFETTDHSYTLSVSLHFHDLDFKDRPFTLTFKFYERFAGDEPKKTELVEGFPKDEWYMIAFSISASGSLDFYSANVSASTLKKQSIANFVQPGLTWKLVKLSHASLGKTLTGATRVYAGHAPQERFEEELRCGLKSLCNRLARALPSQRRVVCVTMRGSGALEPESSCATSLFYDGTPMDIQARMEIEGVKFYFRDTAWDESGFEIERLAIDDTTLTYKTVVTVSNDLNGCATIFNSIVYMDGQASQTPNAEWRYRITSKFQKPRSNGLTFLRSKAAYFKTPWRASVEGYVYAGASTTGVRDVRICADFMESNATMRKEKLKALAKRSRGLDLALHKRVTHSDAKVRGVFAATSPSSSDSVLVASNDYLRVDLGSWSSVESIEVCVKVESTNSANILEAYVHDLPIDSEKHGNRCELDLMADSAAASDKCAGQEGTTRLLKFSCVGSRARSFHGQFIDVVAVSKSVVQSISATGTQTLCKHSALTDEDGRYEMTIEDDSGNVKMKSKLHFGAYKEEIRSSSEVSLNECAKNESYVYMILSSTASTPLLAQSVSESLSSASNSTDGNETLPRSDEKMFTRFQLEENVRDNATTDRHFFPVIDDTLWKRLDVDADGLVTQSQRNDFIATLGDLGANDISALIFMVFPTCEIEHKSHFEVVASLPGACGEFALVRRDNTRMPVTARDYRSLYDSTFKRVLANSKAETCRPLTTAQPVPQFGDDKLKFAIPVLMISDPSAIPEESSSVGMALDLTITARERPPDIIHVFGKPPKTKGGTNEAASEVQLMENIFSDSAMHKITEVEIFHKRIVEKDIIDNTAIIVRGAVLFPKQITQESTSCGLDGAVIEVMNTEGEIEEHTTDNSGWFEISLTPGRRYVVRSRYKEHVICYAGDQVNDALSDARSCSEQNIAINATTPKSQEEAIEHFQHSTVTLENPTQDTYVFFTDATKSKLDLGLFKGECDAKYGDAIFKATPVNGCHAPIIVSSHDIGNWFKPILSDGTEEDGFADDNDSLRIPFWPYAAIEYSFTLLKAPGAPDVVYEKIREADMINDCSAKEEVLDILKYFEQKDELVKYANLRDSVDGVQVRYKYHGFMCASIRLPKVDNDNQVCYRKTESLGSLTAEHFIGETGFEELKGRIDVGAKEVAVEVFELHGTYDSNGEFNMANSTCRIFPSSALQTGNTVVSMRQDVTDESSNPCHPNRGGGSQCDFELVTDEDSGLVLFPGDKDSDSQDYAVVNRGEPNLAFPYRRSFSVTVTRFDNYFKTSLYAKRPLISLGPKVRSSKYDLSDDTFWATVPMEGLVYTVVHDPPGGDSYAELGTGTKIGLSFELSGTRAASSDRNTVSEMQADTELEVNPGVNAGVGIEAEMSAPVKMLTMKGDFTYSMHGPKLEMTSVNQSGWDLEMSTDRVIRSSQDPAIAGRTGDSILGGGVELVYKISDQLDVYSDTGCLRSEPFITWEPRRPTTYIFTVASIERQVIPNLEFLLTTVSAGNVASDGSDMPFKCVGDTGELGEYGPIANCSPSEIVKAWTAYLLEKLDSWRRTLDWASPQVYTIESGGKKKKNYDTIKKIMTPAMSDESVFGRNYADKSQLFTDEFIDKDTNDVMEELSDTWDASFWMMPFNGFGPPPMFPDAKALAAGNVWGIPSEYWEPDLDPGHRAATANAVAKITGKDPSEDALTASKSDLGPSSRAISRLVASEAAMSTNKKKKALPLLTESVSEMRKLNANIKAAKLNSRLAKFDRMMEQFLDFNTDFSEFETQKVSKLKVVTKKMKELKTKLASKLPDPKKWFKWKLPDPTDWKMNPKFKTISDKAGKNAKTSALKVIASATIFGALESYKSEIRKSTYPYVSFPREAYRESVPKIEDAFKGDSGGIYTFGSLTSALDDLSRTFHSCPQGKPLCSRLDYNDNKMNASDTAFSEKFALGENQALSREDLENRVTVSFTGGKAFTGMYKRGNASEFETDSILLTFSGGGHSVEYTFQSSESIVDNHYTLNVGLHAEAANEHDIQWGGLLGFPIMLGLAIAGVDDKSTWTFTKDISYDRSFVWNKHGQVSTQYTLGDPHLGDKFVVQVGSDIRFGTPVFITMGGRSLCPGEPLTIWREAGIEFATLQPSLANTDLPPGDRATLVLTIINESPYREASPIGLQIVDLVAESVTAVIDAAYDNAWKRASPKEVYEAVREAASLSKASEHEIIKSMLEVAKNAADDAAADESLSGFEVARKVYQKSVEAPDVGYEMHDLEFLAMYEWIPPLGDVVPLKFAGGDGLRTQNTVRKTSFTLTIGRGGSAPSKIEYVGLRLVSLCEFELQESRNFDRAPIGDTVRLGTITWAHQCPSVAFGKRTAETYAYKAISIHDDKKLEIEIEGDLSSDDVKFCRLQYRRVSSGGEWISARTRTSDGGLAKADLRDFSATNLIWDIGDENLLSGYKDGEYEIRVKNFCGGSVSSGADVYQYVSDQTLTLRVDTSAPTQQGKYQDKSSRTIWVKYLEEIDCSETKVTLRKVLDESCKDVVHGIVSQAELKSEWKIMCVYAADKGEWLMEYPSSASGFFELQVENIKDIAGNVADDFTWQFTASNGVEDCSKYICNANERVSGGKCVACETGYARPAGDNVRGGEDTMCETCAENHKRVQGGCVPCDPGSVSAGGVASECVPTYCDGSSQYVSSHECQSCPVGSERSKNFTEDVPGDDASAGDTSCDQCSAGYFRKGQTCVRCPKHKMSAAGATSIDACISHRCARDEYVRKHECVACPLGYANEPGDDVAGSDSSCGFCAAGFFASKGACLPCATGTWTRSANETKRFDRSDVSIESDCPICASNFVKHNGTCVEVEGYQTTAYGAGGESHVKPILCDAGQMINATNHACEDCPVGYNNSLERVRGDKETYHRFSCTLCAANHHVSKGACVACEAGYVNDEGDEADPRADAGETTCKKCAADHYVENDACVRCPVGRASPEGSRIADGNTTCDDCAVNYYKHGDECKRCADDEFSDGGADATCTPVKCIADDAKDVRLAVFLDHSRKLFKAIRTPYHEYVRGHKCVRCETGHFAFNESATSCDYCDAVEGFAPDGFGGCAKHACPIGYSSWDPPNVSLNSSRNIPSCTRCAPQYFMTANGDCEPCPDGTSRGGIGGPNATCRRLSRARLGVGAKTSASTPAAASAAAKRALASTPTLTDASPRPPSDHLKNLVSRLVPLIAVFALGVVYQDFSTRRRRPSSEPTRAVADVATPLLSRDGRALDVHPYGTAV